MKYRTLSIIVCLFSFFIFSCGNSLSSQCVKGKGELIKESRKVENFSRIEMRGSANVFFKQGDLAPVIVEAQENLMELIETYVDGNTLVIKNKKCYETRKEVNIYITMPQFEGIDLSGSGNVKNKSDIKGGQIELKLSGSGNIDLDNLSASSIKSSISGSGNISLAGSGKVGNQEIKIPGSGTFSAFDMVSENTKISISGSGSCDVNVESSLDISISGSGSVAYKGNPEVHKNISGSGDVHRKY